MAPRGIKTAALALIAAMMIMLICACAADDPAWNVVTPDETPAATAAPADQNEERVYDRLELTRYEELVDERSVMICPAVADDEYSYISTLIAIRVRSRIRSYDYAVSTAFRIKCNANGVLSMLISFYDLETDKLIDQLPITYDLALGREIQIQDCFEEGDGAWRSVLAARVQSAAEGQNMTLLNDIMPIEDGRLFYLTGAGITVMYRPYEITTGLDPWPELSIPLYDIKRWLKDGGALDRLLKAEGAETEIIIDEYNGEIIWEVTEENAAGIE